MHMSGMLQLASGVRVALLAAVWSTGVFVAGQVKSGCGCFSFLVSSSSVNSKQMMASVKPVDMIRCLINRPPRQPQKPGRRGKLAGTGRSTVT